MSELLSPEFKKLLLESPDSQLDAQMFPYIEKWSETPTSLEILEVLDYCVRYALASGFMLNILNILLDGAMQLEGTTLEEVVKHATWRKDHD